MDKSALGSPIFDYILKGFIGLLGVIISFLLYIWNNKLKRDNENYKEIKISQVEFFKELNDSIKNLFEKVNKVSNDLTSLEGQLKTIEKTCELRHKDKE